MMKGRMGKNIIDKNGTEPHTYIRISVVYLFSLLKDKNQNLFYKLIILIIIYISHMITKQFLITYQN